LKFNQEGALLVRPHKGENPLDNNDFEKIVRRFMRVVAQSGIMREVRLKQAFEPASVKRRRKRTAARKRRK